MSFSWPILLASDFSGLAYEGLFFLFLVILVVVALIVMAVWALRKIPVKATATTSATGTETKKGKLIWTILAWIWLVLGSLVVALITDTPWHELLFSKTLNRDQVWPSLFIVIIGIFIVLLALRNARSVWNKFWMWAIMVWFGYLAIAMGLSLVMW